MDNLCAIRLGQLTNLRSVIACISNKEVKEVEECKEHTSKQSVEKGTKINQALGYGAPQHSHGG